RFVDLEFIYLDAPFPARVSWLGPAARDLQCAFTMATSGSGAGNWAGRAGLLARALRVATGTDSRRLGNALWAGVSGAVRGVRVAATALFHQVTGFFFAIFAVIGGFAAWREYQRYALKQIGPGR